MKQFFKNFWFYLRFIWYYVAYKPTTQSQSVPQPENDRHPTESDIYKYTDKQWENNSNQETYEIKENDMVNKETKNVIICLDNGHGEETPGKRSPWSACKVPPELPFHEYSYCRDIVSRLAQVLHENGYPVYIVTPEVNDVRLEERGKRINKVVEDAKKQGMHVISISIHNNAAGNGRVWKNASGWSVWTTHGQNNSDKLAQCLFDSAKEILTPLGQKIRHDISDGDDDYEDNFAMCRIPNCPAVLTENMFQDNINDVKFLTSEEGKNMIVGIHHHGIIKFIKLMGW